MKGIRYSGTEQAAFSETLNQRVEAYFQQHEIDPLSNRKMLWKSILLFGSYIGIFSVILFAGINNLIVLVILWATLGLFLSFIGMSVMHDAVHGAYSKNRFVNLLLQIPIVLIGVESKIWRIEHNILHHTYPNVEGIDQDIHPRFVFRFTIDQRRRWFHGFQHLYATLFYALLLIEWLTVKDFIKVIKYHRLGFLKTRHQALTLASVILIKKLLFYAVFLGLPLLTLDFKPIQITGMLLTMLAVAGVSMTIIFQLAHVVPSCETIAEPNDLRTKNWHVHQLETTCNFAHQNRVLSYLIGGLNYQIEHHLFPHICHQHYPSISGIVKQTAEEFDVPYYYEPTFKGAIAMHYKHLREMGRK